MKKSTKKLIGLFVASSLVMSSFAACNKEEENVTATPTPAQQEAEATVAPTEAPKDLGGTEIIVGDWWTTDPAPEPATQKEEDTIAYREDFMKKYNFTLKRQNLGTWGEYQEIMVSSVMAGDPAADVFIMDQGFISAPLQQGLLYPLQTIKNFDFSEEKWNKQVIDLMTFDGNSYAMASGRMEPRLGIFFNKRLLEEAGVDPELPYNLQASGEWTWDAFKDLASKLTRDTNSDGTPDVYGLASFSVHWFRGVVFSNNAQFIGKDENGKFYNATGEANFLEALEWGRSLYDEGFVMPNPEGANWDWFIAAFKEGKVAMQCSEEYMVNTWKDMEDDWGFVIFPKGPQGEMMTVFTENLVVMPAGMDAQRAEDVAFAYNLYTNPTPGYENDDFRTDYYTVFRDARAVDETLALFYEDGHGTMSNLPLVAGVSYGDICYGLDGGTATPAETIEKVESLWQSYIDTANGVEAAE